MAPSDRTTARGRAARALAVTVTALALVVSDNFAPNATPFADDLFLKAL